MPRWNAFTARRAAGGRRGIEPLLMKEQTNTLVMKSLENGEQQDSR
jgi:hypothetical protein